MTVYLLFTALTLFPTLEVAIGSTITTNFAGESNKLATSPEQQPVLFYIDSSTLNERDELIRQALSLWTGVEGSFLILEETDDPNAAQISIEGQKNKDQKIFEPTYDDHGKFTQVTYRFTKSFLNEDDSMFFEGAAHESGHVLGLPHTANSGSVMSYSRIGLTDLSDDDRLSLSLAYPAENDPLPPGCAVLGNAQSGENAWWSIVILFLPAMIIIVSRAKNNLSP